MKLLEHHSNRELKMGLNGFTQKVRAHTIIFLQNKKHSGRLERKRVTIVKVQNPIVIWVKRTRIKMLRNFCMILKMYKIVEIIINN